MYLINIILLLTLLLRPTYCFLSDTNSTACVRPYYLTGLVCSENCPVGTFGNFDTGLCEELPHNFTTVTNATAYSISFNTTIQPGTVVLNYSVIINEAVTGPPVAIILSLSGPEVVVSLFAFDNGMRTKDYDNQLGLPSAYLMANNISHFQESITVQGMLPETEFQFSSDIERNFKLKTLIIVIGKSYEDISTVFASIHQSSPCDNNPCLNSGLCIPNLANFTYMCDCPPEFSGDKCEFPFDSCSINPCLHNRTCLSMGAVNYTCECGIEYTGKQCETRINHCKMASDVCNNGTCIDGVGSFTCQCSDGFTGLTCETEVDECEIGTCRNGRCIDLLNDYMCDCYVGWTGRQCETDIDYCVSNSSLTGPCDILGSNSCMDGNDTYICTCVAGWTGTNCSIDINDCKPNPCLNNGSCTNLPFENYLCNCLEGYSGPNCDIDLTPCDPNPCMNRGTCEDTGRSYSQSVSFVCMCSPGYSGTFCETNNANLSNSEGTTITAIGITFAITFIAALTLGVGIGVVLMCALRRMSTVGKYSPKKEQEVADHDPSTYTLSSINTIQNVSYVPINVD